MSFRKKPTLVQSCPDNLFLCASGNGYSGALSNSTVMETPELPAWAEEIRSIYLRGESSVFVLHGNVFDDIQHGDRFLPLTEFLSEVLLGAKEIIAQFNPATGVRFRKKEKFVENLDQLIGVQDVDKALGGLESLMLTQDRVGLIVDYAEMIAPSGDTGFQSETDRRSIVTLHRWSLERRFDFSDSVVFLVTEQLSQLSNKLVANPKVSSIRVELPDQEARQSLIRQLEPDATEFELNRLAELSAGLKSVQIKGILQPGSDEEEELSQRVSYIARLLGDTPEAKVRAEKLAPKFAGESYDEIRAQLQPEPSESEDTNTTESEPDSPETLANRYEDVLKLLNSRKRKILEKECFGLVEFVEPSHDFSAVGGMEEVKKELLSIADHIKTGRRTRVPMGLLFTGPMGTGKTFVAEAFARSSGLTAIKLKNFRSKWVGSTEGNLEKILDVVKAIGNILVIIDEGDRAFGNQGGDGDGGTSSRVIARIKEFMSDRENRGRVLFVLMTNRPDKLDIDIKRAGRLDRKIPFFYASAPEGVEVVLLAQLARHKIHHNISFPEHRELISEPLLGYSNAELEAIVLLANNYIENDDQVLDAELLKKAIVDFLPSRDETMLEYMELLAVFETSSRSLLPAKFREIPVEDLQARMTELRRLID
ncbi:MAG: AAA family ATPase [Myxococcota bacterium]|nr:AAA family ATPase [Myxococcota bacterium]